MIERGTLMSVYYSVLSKHWGGRGGRRLETMYFVTFGGTLSKSPIDGDLPAKIGTWSPNGCDLPIRSVAGVSMLFNSLHEDNNIVHINEDFALAPVGQGHGIYGSL